jgi:hypothetical protein
MRRAIVGAGLLLGLVGCSGAQKVPTEALVDSQVSIRAADEAGAAQVPEAARHLQLAKEQTAEGQALLEDGKRDQAALYLKRAAADAELALALAKEAPAKAEAQRAMEQVRALQRGASGGSGTQQQGPAAPPPPPSQPQQQPKP